MKKVLVSAVIGLLALAPAASASATVHEIVGQWCAGQGPLFPPGISEGSNADNAAQPLFATGFASIEEGFDPGDGREPGVLIAFDFDHPASKVSGLGIFIQIDELPDGTPVYVEAVEPDSDHPFAHCARLRA